MVHLILTGATGLVGSGVLDAMIKMKEVSKISILSRRAVKMADDVKDPRINVIIHKDFEQYDAELLSQLKDATGCVWALGISQSQVGKDEYIKITKTFSIKAAEAFKTLGSEEKPFNFVYVSGAGSTLQPGLFTAIFARVKGETETLLASMRNSSAMSFHPSSVRPCFIDSKHHDAIKPYLPRRPVYHSAAEWLLAHPIRLLASGYWSPTLPLGTFLTEMAMGKWDGEMKGEGIEKLGDFPIIENSAFRRIKELDQK